MDWSLSWNHFWQQQRSSRFEMCECVCPFLCVLMRERGSKNRGCPWVQLHAYAWTHSPPVRSWLTHTCQRLNLSWHMPPQLCNAVQQCAVWGQLGIVCLLYVCLPLMEFMKELRDQTAADGVCLVAVQALLYPVGQYNSHFLSYHVYNSCQPAAKCLSRCVCRAREGRGFWRKHWLTGHCDKNRVLTEAYAIPINSCIPSLDVFSTLCLYFIHWRGF